MGEVRIGPTNPSDRVPDATHVVQPSVPGQVARVLGGASKDGRPAPVPGQDEFDRLDLERIMLHAYAQFSVEAETGIVSVKIIDSRTNEVIREIPSEALLRFAQEVEAYLEARQRSGI